MTICIFEKTDMTLDRKDFNVSTNCLFYSHSTFIRTDTPYLICKSNKQY